MKKLIAILLILSVLIGCATMEPEPKASVIFTHPTTPEELRMDPPQPWYEDVVSFVNRYGGCIALMMLPFLIFGSDR